MANLYISEFRQVGYVSGPVDIAELPPIAQQKIAFGVPSAAFNERTVYVRLFADESCSVEVTRGDATPAPTVSMMPLAASQPEYFAIRRGDIIQAIANPLTA